MITNERGVIYPCAADERNQAAFEAAVALCKREGWRVVKLETTVVEQGILRRRLYRIVEEA